MIPIRATLFAAAAWAVMATGCAKLDLQKSSLPWPGHDKQEYGTPQRIIAVWADTVYQQPGKSPARGFGGRVYFYDGERNGIPVDGQLVIYAYDDTSPEASYDQPTRKYAFTAEQLTRYHSDSDLGASYNIWIPWDEVGGEEKQISLFPVFVDKSGRMVRGNFSKNRLPGRRMPSEEERRGFYVARKNVARKNTLAQGPTRADQPVQPLDYASHATNVGTAAAARESGLKTTTIRIPRSLAERMAASGTTPVHGRRDQESGRGFSPYPSSGRRQNSPRPSAYYTAQARQNRPSPPNPGTATLPRQPGLEPEAMVSGYQLPGSPSRSQNPSRSAMGQSRVARRAGQQPERLRSGGRQTHHPADRPTNGTGIPNAPLGRQGFAGAQPQHSVSATSRAWARQHAESAHFEPPRFRAPAKPGVPRHLGREPIQQSPLVPPSSLPSPN